MCYYHHPLVSAIQLSTVIITTTTFICDNLYGS